MGCKRLKGMIVLFTLNFRFKNKEYIALVSLRQQSDELNCLVRYIGRGLPYLAPGDNLVFSLDGQLKAPGHFPDDLCKTLNQCTADAVSRYLQLSQNQAAA